MAVERTSTAAWKKQRQEVFKRDDYTCHKCGRRNALQAHHIKAVMHGGSDDMANLATLCAGCHAEWDMMEALTDIGWQVWLALPSAASLVAIFSKPAEWTAGISAKDMHAAITQSAAAMKHLSSQAPRSGAGDD